MKGIEVRKYSGVILVVLTCLLFAVPVSFALAAKFPGSPGRSALLSSPASSTLAVCPASTSGNWPTFGYNATGIRYNSSERKLKPSNAGTLVQDWSYSTSDWVQSSPAIVNRMVYIGSDDGNLYALNASTGVLLWSYAAGYGGILGSPAVANGVVYIGANHINQNMFALNASTGALLWSYALDTATVASPTVANGIVYIMDDNGKVYALNAKNGKLLWSYTTGTGNGGLHSQVVANGVLYFGSNDSKLYALNAKTGVLLWSYTTVGYVAAAPAVANGVVYVGGGNEMYALNASTGVPLWSYATGSYVQTEPAIANGVIYIGSDDYKVYALNATSGALLWSYATGSYVIDSPAVANGVVYVGSYDDKMYALNASTGAALWSYTIGGPYIDGSPAISNGLLYIGSTDHHLYAFSLPAVMQVSPSTLSFTANAGGINPPGQTISLGNSGGSAITWTGCSSQPWAALTPTTGSIAARTGSSLTVTVDTTGLAPGVYSATVAVVPSVGPAKLVPVTLTVM